MSAFYNPVQRRAGLTFVLLSKMLSSVIIFTLFLVLLINSSDAIFKVGTGFFSTVWDPPDNLFGILPMLYGTFSVTLLALLFALPPGLGSAVYISEIARPEARGYLKMAIEILAGIPSIIYGLIGIIFLTAWVKEAGELSTGRTILTASILLAFMVLPTIMTLSEDALQSVPQKYREASLSMGLTKFETVTDAILPIARPGIIAAIMLSMGRAIGETMAVMLVIGSIDRLPDPLWNPLLPGQTITSKLGREIAESSIGSLHFSALVTLGLFLFMIVITITFAAYTFFMPDNNRLYE